MSTTTYANDQVLKLNHHRSHLEIRHSEKAKAKDKSTDENARFYMDDQTLSRVKAICNDYDRRPHSQKDEYATELFIAVWDALFPSKELSTRQRPLSACASRILHAVS